MARSFQIVIVGAASTGCGLALALINHGIHPQNIILIDERAGTYVRTGMLMNNSIFCFLEQLGVAILDEYWKYHMSIKDLERMLYKQVMDKHICIENKAFLRMHADPKQPGVIIGGNRLPENITKNASKIEEELITCEYVFDCTGPQCVVLADMSKVLDLNDEPIVKKIPTIQPRTHYVVASVTIPEQQRKLLSMAITARNRYQLFNQTALEFTQHINILRSFGWRGWYLPHLVAFSKASKEDAHLSAADENALHKMCIYIEAPANLQGDAMGWLKAVTQALCNVPLSLELVHPSRKYGLAKDKLRLQYFQVHLNCVRDYIALRNDLPMVIPQGDAVQTPLFEIGHGLKYTAKRIKACLDSFTISQGKLGIFDYLNYQNVMNSLFNAQLGEVRRKYNEIVTLNSQALYPVARIYAQALTHLECSAGNNEIQIQQLFEQAHEVNQCIAAYEEGLRMYLHKKFNEIPPRLYQEFQLMQLYSKQIYFGHIGQEIKKLAHKIGENYRQNKIEDALKYAYQRVSLFVEYSNQYHAEKPHILLMASQFITLYDQAQEIIKHAYLKHWITMIGKVFTTQAKFTETDAIKQDIYARVLHQLKELFPRKEQFLRAYSESPFIQIITKLIRDHIEFFNPETSTTLLDDQPWFLTEIHSKNASRAKFFSPTPVTHNKSQSSEPASARQNFIVIS